MAKWQVGEATCSRVQLPICLAFAITIHKSQGWTCAKVRLDLGTSEHSLGIAFVAVSSAKSLDGIAFEPADVQSLAWKRFDAVNKCKGHEARRAVDQKLKAMHEVLERELQA